MHSHNESTIKSEIIDVCKRLYGRGMLAAADGNISFRISDNVILITPSGVAKYQLQPSQIAAIDLENTVLWGNPSSESWMHLEVYRQCPKAQGVVHAHPPTAIAWSIAYPSLQELPSEAMSSIIPTVGQIPIIPYARPGTRQLGKNLQPFLPHCRVMILARHGALSWGESLEEAYSGMERLEHSAQILKIAKDLGGITLLADEEVAALKELRKKLGDKIL